MDHRRRKLIIGIGATIALLATACSTFRSRSEIDLVADELEAQLRSLNGPGMDERLAIAEDLRREAQALRDAHDTFAKRFNQLALDRDVPALDLHQLFHDYEMERTAMRKKMLETQDRLHATLSDGQWPQVLDILNRKSAAVASGRGTVG